MIDRKELSNRVRGEPIEPIGSDPADAPMHFPHLGISLRTVSPACDYCGRTDPPKGGRCDGCGATRKAVVVELPKPPRKTPPPPDRDIL